MKTPVTHRCAVALNSDGSVRTLILTALLLCGAAFAPVTHAQVISAHPRLLLDASTLATLRQRAVDQDPDWLRLKQTCDLYIGGTVNFPDQSTYPGPPTIGSAYGGHAYRAHLMNQGLCYQVMKGIHPAQANAYGDKVAQILNVMSIPSGPHYVNPCRFDGYLIRTYGVAMGIGYDWAYDRLSPALRAQVYTAANLWVQAFEQTPGCADFEYVHPQSNYYAGYFHAKAAIALGTYGDNPLAPLEWDDWLNNQFRQRVQPYYSTYLAGGGWPEGFGNYAPNGILDMSLPIREVKTATGIDLYNAAAAYAYPTDSGKYVMHFTWPSRDYFDDRDTNHSNGNAMHQPGENDAGMFVHILGAMRYWNSPQAGVFQTYLNDVAAATGDYRDDQPWQRFLFAAPQSNTAPLATLPRSYLANGMGMVAARSDWTTRASWMSFRSGTYVNNPNQGEQYFDQGSLALVHGDTPLLLNATGWIVHEPGGAPAEEAVYNDNRGPFIPADVYSGNRQIYNVFYVRHMNGSVLAEPFGQNGKAATDGARTKVAAFEDDGAFVYAKGSHLEDMYRDFDAGPAVAAWSRAIVYLRPDRFVVYDRTRKGATSYDQYLAFHFPAQPTNGSAAPGTTRLDVTFNGDFAGSATFVYPANVSLKTTAMYPNSTPTRVWQVQERPADNDVTQRWVSVFDMSSSRAKVAVASPVTITQGNVLGVALSAPDGNAVIILNNGDDGHPVTGTVAYTVAKAAARHVVIGVQPNAHYGVSANVSGNAQYVSITAGGELASSANGVLSFMLDKNGQPLPIDTLMRAGFDP